MIVFGGDGLRLNCLRVDVAVGGGRGGHSHGAGCDVTCSVVMGCGCVPVMVGGKRVDHSPGTDVI